MMKLKKRFHKLSPENRLYHYDRPVIGLTGGIATGKSTVSRLLQDKGIQIIDADKLVKEIYATPEAKAFIQGSFPECMKDHEIDFKALREQVFSNQAVKAKIESFIYARLPDAFRKAASQIKNQDFYLYDVPLLFERQLNSLVDLVIVVYAEREVQLARLIHRDGNTEAVAKKILDQQMDIEAKKLKADLVVNNSGTLMELAAEVDQLLLQILE